MVTTDPARFADYLDPFSSWLASLGADAAELSAVVDGPGEARVLAHAAGGLQHVLKSLDLVPAGIEDLGFCDVAFVLRVAASLAVDEGEGADAGILVRLSQEAKMLSDFLDDEYPRLVAYVRGLRTSIVRGRTVDAILSDAALRSSFLGEVLSFAETYSVPAFAREARTLTKLKAFLSAKLAP